jgi:hypothetical protein
MARVPDLPCAGTCGKLMWRSGTSLPEGQAMCRDCRSKQPYDHGTYTAYNSKRCRCEVCRAWKSRQHVDYMHRRMAGQYDTPQCVSDGCDRLAIASRGMCRMHYRRWERANGRATSPSNAWSDTRRSNYHARRARANGANNGDKVLVAALIERDGLRCSACLLPIDQHNAWPDPFSLSIDHTLPISRGGQHTLSNTTLMHLRCNISKGSQVNGDQSEQRTA